MAKPRGKLFKLSEDDQEALWLFMQTITYDDALGSAELPLLAGYVPSRSALAYWYSNYTTGRKFQILNNEASFLEEFAKNSKSLKFTAEQAADLGDAWLILRSSQDEEDKTYISARNMMISEKSVDARIAATEEKLKQGEQRLEQGEKKLELEREAIALRKRDLDAKLSKITKVAKSGKLTPEQREAQIREIFGG